MGKHRSGWRGAGKDLFNKLEAHRLANPDYALKSAMYYQALLYHDPNALCLGAGVWADSATGLQGIETWLNAHPALLSLVQNTGTVVGGVMWLKNLTPVGLVSYLVVNYGYNQVLSLLDGNTEVAKQHLTTYFSEHDAEITPEQASYLGNVAMQVLHTAGQIVVHQVAATKFNAVRQGSGVKQSIEEKGGAGKINKVPVGQRSNPISVVEGTNVSTIINGRKFTRHALDSMQGRGFIPMIVEDVIKHPTKIIPGKTSGTTIYIGEKLKVVLNKAGDVINVIPQ
jgi:hypothetical protein